MAGQDKRIDAYIARSADFARPILVHLRAAVWDACPEVEETVKWGMPHFQYRGMLCSMAAFKAHCSFGFWKGALMVDSAGKADDAMGQFGRITRVRDLPGKTALRGYIRKAMALNEAGIKIDRPQKHPKPALRTPPVLAAALRRNASARETYDAFSPSHRREYIEWLVETRSEATLARRLAQAVEWMSQGKTRHWKYQTRRKET